MDMFFTGYAVLKIQTVFIGMQFIIRNTDFTAFGDGDGDLTTIADRKRKNSEEDCLGSLIF